MSISACYHLSPLKFLTRSSATDNRTVIEADMSTDAEVASDIALTEPAMPLDAGITPSTDTVSDADLPLSSEVVDTLDEASAQARVEEAGETAHNPTHLTDQPVIDSFEPDNPQDANAGAAASFAEAIPVAQLTTRTHVPDPPRSGEQVPDGDLATQLSAQTTEVEADTVDRDIADIANNWPAPAISEALKRLRQARGLLPTDLSYDAGWVTAFEAERWHTYQSDRQRYINGIRTYLQALGMTPAELQRYLPPLMRYQKGRE